MITIDLTGRILRVNQSKLPANPDPWHGVHILGLEGRDLAPVKDVSAPDEETGDGRARGTRP
eukprot:6014265-Prorocentrum_lima.AAC.1